MRFVTFTAPSDAGIGMSPIRNAPAMPYAQDTITVAPGERYTVLYTALDKGVWAWHCHILTHAETPSGMTGMVTALIVQ